MVRQATEACSCFGVLPDSAGHFMARFSKRVPVPLTLAPDEFLSNSIYELVSAPPHVKPDIEDNASDVQIVVRLVPRHARVQQR